MAAQQLGHRPNLRLFIWLLGAPERCDFGALGLERNRIIGRPTSPAAAWGICASAENSLRTRLRAHAQRPRCIAVFDEWSGDVPQQTVVWCGHQDFSTMGALVAEILVDRVEGRDPKTGLRTVARMRSERQTGKC